MKKYVLFLSLLSMTVHAMEEGSSDGEDPEAQMHVVELDEWQGDEDLEWLLDYNDPRLKRLTVKTRSGTKTINFDDEGFVDALQGQLGAAFKDVSADQKALIKVFALLQRAQTYQNGQIDKQVQQTGSKVSARQRFWSLCFGVGQWASVVGAYVFVQVIIAVIQKYG